MRTTGRRRMTWKLDLRVNDTTELEIFGVKNPPERVTNPEAAGLRHLAFHTSDIEATRRSWRQREISVEPIRVDEFSNRKFTFFADPDGLPIELHE